jgi:hypothetical protein
VVLEAQVVRRNLLAELVQMIDSRQIRDQPKGLFTLQELSGKFILPVARRHHLNSVALALAIPSLRTTRTFRRVLLVVQFRRHPRMGWTFSPFCSQPSLDG